MYSITSGDKKISFNVKRKNVKNINLTVKPNLEVSVSANKKVSEEYIKEFVYRKANWIEKKLNYYESIQGENPGEKEYVNGEYFRYLGKQYRLKVFKSSEEHVKYLRGYIHLYSSNLDDINKKKTLLENWYVERSQIIFKESLQRTHELVKAYDIEFPDLVIRKMKSRWGSCHVNQNKITLNSVLIRAPKDCIDYVVLHELIHFKHANHGKDFYRLLNIIMPDWREKKKLLDELIIWEI